MTGRATPADALMRAALAVSAVLIVAGCLAQAPDGPAARLENGTTVPVAVYMNDSWVGTYPPGAEVDVPIGRAEIPVVIEARSPSGALLVSFTATADDIAGTAGGAGMTVSSCGPIRLSVSQVELDPLPTPEVAPGPCP